MNKATIALTFRNDAGTSIISSQDIEQDGLVNIEREGINPGSEVQFDIGITASTIKGIAMAVTKTKGEASDKTVLANIYTNDDSTGSPAQTFTGLTTSRGLGWSNGMVTANPITTSITAIYVKNTGTAKIDFALRALLDVTPVEVG